MPESFSEETKTILEARVEDFSNTSDEILQEISDFNWLWPVFEALALRWCGGNQLTEDTFDTISKHDCISTTWETKARESSYIHFQERYLKNPNQLTDLAKANAGSIRAKILKGLGKECSDQTEQSLSLLLITYRLRNNLFHGAKGGAGFTDQKENFEAANNLLKLWLSHNLHGEDL